MTQQKLTDEDVGKIRELKRDGWKQIDIAKLFKISECTVSNIIAERNRRIKVKPQRPSSYCEIWKDVPGYEDKYQASNKGRIWSKISNKILKQNKNIHEYIQIGLSGKKMLHIHKIIALTFIGERPEGHFINHKDENKQNNCLENLEYVTAAENTKKHIALNTNRILRGEQKGNSRFTDRDILKIKKLSKEGMSNKDIGILFNTKGKYIWAIISGKKWSHINDFYIITDRHSTNNIYNPDEIWKPIKKYEKLYEVSNHGNVRNKSNKLKKSYNYNNYKYTSLSKDGKLKTLSIHSIVMDAFIGDRPKTYVINHKNGKKSDNTIENLEYVTRSENSTHSTSVLKKNIGETSGSAKLKEQDAINIINLYKTGGYTQTNIAKIYSMSNGAIQQIINGNTWKYLKRN